MKRIAALATVLAALAGGCTRLVDASEERVAVDTEWLGALMPGARFMLSWPAAEYHCGKFGKRPALTDMRDGVVAYTCVASGEGAGNGRSD